jgi:uncharacterized protein YwgA
LTRRDWLALFIAFEGAPGGLDPVRLQKGMFLFRMEAKVPETQKYSFRPYNYGPMSAGIYSDLDALVEEGAVKTVPVEGQSWSLYQVTGNGIQDAHVIIEAAAAEHEDAVKHLFQIKQSVAGMTFAELLEDVYDRYPDYATASVFRRRA